VSVHPRGKDIVNGLIRRNGTKLVAALDVDWTLLSIVPSNMGPGNGGKICQVSLPHIVVVHMAVMTMTMTMIMMTTKLKEEDDSWAVLLVLQRWLTGHLLRRELPADRDRSWNGGGALTAFF
jgi:hypothetical protein